jgi:flagellar protein FliS
MRDKISEYIRSDTGSNSQIELIVKVYNGAINNLSRARRSIQSGDISSGYQAFEDSKKFLVHLYTTLNMEKGGEIAQNLSSLYSFLINEINLVQASRDLKQLDEIMAILSNVKEGWMELSQQSKSKQSENKGVSTANTNKSLSISA